MGQLFFLWLIMGLCANVAILSDTFFVESESIILVNRVVNNKTLRRLMRQSQHQPDLAKSSKGVPKPLAAPLPPPLRPKKKKNKSVFMKPIEEVVASLECHVDDFDAALSSPTIHHHSFRAKKTNPTSSFTNPSS